MLIANPLFAGTASGAAIHGSSLSASSHGSFGINEIYSEVFIEQIS